MEELFTAVTKCAPEGVQIAVRGIDIPYLLGAVYTIPSILFPLFFFLVLLWYVLQLTQALVHVPPSLSRTIQGAEASQEVKLKDFQLIKVPKPKSAVRALDNFLCSFQYPEWWYYMFRAPGQRSEYSKNVDVVMVLHIGVLCPMPTPICKTTKPQGGI